MELNVELPLRALFEVKTVEELARVIEDMEQPRQHDMDEIARVLDQLEHLSEEMVRDLLEETSYAGPEESK
jgi:uncharacterized protein Yka (UPF0111/DUF47 family)